MDLRIRGRKLLAIFFITLLAVAGVSLRTHAQDQDIGPSVFIGTQFPLQYTAGINYHFTPAISARAQVGLLTKPYDWLVLKTMERFGLEESKSRLIERALDHGLLFSVGANYHLGKNHIGIYGQYSQLRGSITLEEALGAYLNTDVSFLDPLGFSLLELSAKSSLVNLGVLYGRKFVLPNPKFEIVAEAGIARVITSTNTFESNQGLLERLPVVQQLYTRLDNDFSNAYRKYGYLPTINLYLNYRF